MNGVDKDDNPMRITRWLYAKGKEFSGHARGGPITGEAWCLCEVEALAKKGVKVRMVHHPELAGYVALEREALRHAGDADELFAGGYAAKI